MLTEEVNTGQLERMTTHTALGHVEDCGTERKKKKIEIAYSTNIHDIHISLQL